MAANARAAALAAHPERRLFQGLDVLVDTCLPGSGELLAGNQLARLWLMGSAVSNAACSDAALLDRLAHHAVVITPRGKSFRMRKRTEPAEDASLKGTKSAKTR